MRMLGTVECRPTVAYGVQIDGINIATELIRLLKRDIDPIARPTSVTLAQHWANIGYMYKKIVLLSSKQKKNLYNYLYNVGPTSSSWFNIA